MVAVLMHKETMKKKDVITALGPFADEDELTISLRGTTIRFRRICGKGQYAMIYKCVLEPNHTGECYCGCKKLHFIPDQPNDKAQF
jgi:hypothetical protein